MHYVLLASPYLLIGDYYSSNTSCDRELSYIGIDKSKGLSRDKVSGVVRCRPCDMEVLVSEHGCGNPVKSLPSENKHAVAQRHEKSNSAVYP